MRLVRLVQLVTTDRTVITEPMVLPVRLVITEPTGSLVRLVRLVLLVLLVPRV